MDEQTKNYWEQLRDFNLSRTPFWVSFGFQGVLTIGPFVALWLLLGPDFQNYEFNYYLKLKTPQSGYLLLVLVGYLFYTLFGTFLTWICKWQKADCFTFTCGLTLVFISVVANGIWISEWQFNVTVVKVLIRFVLALVCGLLGVILGLLLTTFARNRTYKIEETNYALVLAYRAGEPIAPKDQKHLQKGLLEEQKRAALTLKRDELEQQLLIKYDNYKTQQSTYQRKTKAKMDAKEMKKRQKDQKKQAKKGF